MRAYQLNRITPTHYQINRTWHVLEDVDNNPGEWWVLKTGGATKAPEHGPFSNFKQAVDFVLDSTKEVAK